MCSLGKSHNLDSCNVDEDDNYEAATNDAYAYDDDEDHNYCEKYDVI